MLSDLGQYYIGHSSLVDVQPDTYDKKVSAKKSLFKMNVHIDVW